MLNIFFFAALIIYFAAVLLHFVGIAFKKNVLTAIGKYAYFAAFALHSAYIVMRGIYAGRFPMANQFEFAMSFAWGISLFCIVLQTKFKLDWIVAVAYPATFLMLSYAALLPREITDLMPALRSAWFVLHIGSAVFSYAAFLLAGCAGVRYLLTLRKNFDTKSTQLMQMDYFAYRLIALGMLLLTVVILSGCIWAEQAWSRFWSWDPKETWAFITWVLYAVYLHQRLRKNWQGKRMAIFAIVAVGVVLFTFIGVNQLLPGLHSYA